MHLCLLCHCKATADRAGEDIALPALLERLERVRRETGKRVNVTWAQATAYKPDGSENLDRGQATFEVFSDLYQRLMNERGDEVGLHIHGRHDGKRMLPVDEFIERDTARLIAAGFPAPKTFVAGFFTFHSSTLRVLEQIGYEVDSSMAKGRCEGSGCIFYDNPPSPWVDEARTYRLSYDDVTRQGESSIIEIPYSGHAVEFRRGPEEALVETPDRYEAHIAERFRRRWQNRHERIADTFEIFFHLPEFLQAGWREADDVLLDRIQAFLLDVATWPDVSFPTLSQAAANWRSEAEPVLPKG